MEKGSIVKLHTTVEDEWVPAIVTSDPDADGKCWLTAFPGPAKDDQDLQSPASEILSAPGTGTYEHEAL